MNCKKCNSVGTITLRKKDYYCETCFLASTNHKFRASIGKNKILSSNEKVLICLSGGPGSIVLIDFIHYGLSQDSHKKLRVIPYFVHITGLGRDDDEIKIIHTLKESCTNYGFSLYIVHISDYVLTDVKIQESEPIVNSDTANKFQNILSTMPSTVRNDFITKVKRSLFIRYAKKLECKFVFTAETTTTLAISLLSNIAIGRGSQVENDVGFSDNRNDEVKILKPMRDISREELDHYINIKKLNVVRRNDLNDNSLQYIIKRFVDDLQENFQATVSTVCKTADKIGVKDYNQNNEKCLFCESNVTKENSKLTAFEATNYSRTVSLLQPKQNNENFDNLDNENPSMFPLIHKTLCYGCSRNYSQMSKSELPNHIQNFLHN